MNYEQKYKEALKRASGFKTQECKDVAEYIFPELVESEDERIRKALVKAVSGTLEGTKLFGTDVTREDAIAWLEKQGEKPKQVSIWKHWKDGIAGNSEGKQIFLIKIGNVYSINSCLGCECDYIELSELDKLMREEKQGKPKWTDEDEENFRDIMGAIHAVAYQTTEDEEARINWIKSLKQRMEE